MKIIELCGKAGVGKDTFGKELIRQLESRGTKCIHISFADRLKDICLHYFAWDGNKDAKGRELLQRVGTDMFRKFNPDYWVNEVKELVKVLAEYDLCDYVIITDARFPNEIDTFLQDGFQTLAIRLHRDFKSKLDENLQHHESETALDNYEMNDYYLSGDIEKLPFEVATAISYYEI